MKKIYVIAVLVMAFVFTANAQIDYGIKGGLHFNNIKNATVLSDVAPQSYEMDSKNGFSAGVWARFKIPVVGLYLRPELYYSELKSDLKISGNEIFAFNQKRLELPVLLGQKLFGIGNIFAGPAFQYQLENDFGIDQIASSEEEKFSMSIQTGLGIEVWKLGVDIRYDIPLSKTVTSYVLDDAAVEFDNRQPQFIISLSVDLN